MANAEIDRVYFPITCVLSVVAEMQDGNCAKSYTDRPNTLYALLCYILRIMSQFTTTSSSDKDRHDGKNALIASAVLIALFGFLFLAPRNDPAKVVAGIPCSVLSENAISTVLESRVRLMPTNGTTCEYVPTEASAQRSVFVIAHTSPIAGVRNSSDQAVHVRNGSRWYSIIVVPQNQNSSGHGDEVRLAQLMARSTTVAQNR